MNSLFKNRFLIAYHTEVDDNYLDSDYGRTKREAIKTAKYHLSDQFNRFGLRMVARIYNELRYPNDLGIKITL